jgi:hypothetical protein
VTGEPLIAGAQLVLARTVTRKNTLPSVSQAEAVEHAGGGRPPADAGTEQGGAGSALVTGAPALDPLGSSPKLAEVGDRLLHEQGECVGEGCTVCEPKLGLARTCAGVNRHGQPCASRAVGEDGYCSMHSPTRQASAAELGRKGGLASGEVRREQAKSVRDRLREKVEEQFELVWSAFEAGLLSEDERARVAAAVAALDQAYGRPPQAIVGDGDKPVTFVLASLLERAREQRDQELADVEIAGELEAPDG